MLLQLLRNLIWLIIGNEISRLLSDEAETDSTTQEYHQRKQGRADWPQLQDPSVSDQ